MKCKINRHAAKILKELLDEPDKKGKYPRVVVTDIHGSHAHYALMFDEPKENDEIVKTDKDISVLLDKNDAEWLDGVWIRFFFVPEEGFDISNPSKPNEHHHH